jgi:exonuclease VII small subunit
MEPVGAACAVAQFLGLAGQAIQAIGWLRQEFKDIKSAPKLIKKIHHELKVFENTLVQLSSIEQSRFSDDAARSFEATLTDCAEIVDNLWNELSKHDFDKHVAGAKKLWKQIVANEKRSEFENYLKRLENAKTSLQLTMSGMQLEMTKCVLFPYTRCVGLGKVLTTDVVIFRLYTQHMLGVSRAH